MLCPIFPVLLKPKEIQLAAFHVRIIMGEVSK